MKKIILASASPRRQELLREIISEFEIIPADLDEDALTHPDPSRTAIVLARAKAEAVLKLNPDSVVIGSDTVVAVPIEGKWVQLTKPVDRGDAFRILSLLRGREHRVFTGVAVAGSAGTSSNVDSARVKFHDVTDAQIHDYIDTGEPMDKAGAYGAQGMGAFLVKELIGNLDTVIGLPVDLTRRLLVSMGIR